MTTNLSGLTILVTRPGTAGAELVERIQQSGGVSLHLPTIAFAPASDEQPAIKIADYELLIFTSPQAVQASASTLREVWATLEPKPVLAAVGKGTELKLQQEGFTVALVPEQEWGSEGLLALPEMQHLAGKKVLIVCGEGGRDLLAQTLGARQATVAHWYVYRRVLAQVDTEPALRLMKNNQIHGIVCTSFDGVKNLTTLFGSKVWSSLQQIPIVVVSTRIKALTQSLGYKHVYLAQNASHDAVLAALLTLRNLTCQKK